MEIANAKLFVRKVNTYMYLIILILFKKNKLIERIN